MDFLGFINWLFWGATLTSLSFSYAKIGASVRRALDVRLRERFWVLVSFLALVWPVTLPALAVRDLRVRDSRYPLMLSEEAYRSRVHAQVGATQLEGEAEIRRVHDEWQARLNHFYALGAEAEKAGDWLAGQRVAENLDFLLETEPPRPPEKVAKPKVEKKLTVAKVEREVEKVDMEELWMRIERKAEIYQRESVRPESYFCNVCAKHLATMKFELWRVTGICDPCYTEIHKGDE